MCSSDLSLPERVAHRTKKVQLDIVAVLCLLALFTNEHVFWIAALLLAFIDLPDFLTPVQRIASAAEKIAGGEMKAQSSDAVDASTAAAAAPVSTEAERPEGAPPIQKGAAHA